MRARTLFLFMAAAAVIPQSWAQKAPSFEVATIKPADPAAVGLRIGLTGPGRISITNPTLVDLIRFAFADGLGANLQITGGPNWASREHYNVEAQAEGSPGVEQLRLMVQSMLAERFGLKFHRETKDVEIYALVLAKDGKLGPKVKTWDGTCGGRTPPAAQPNSKIPRCRGMFSPPGLIMEGVTMATVADLFSTPMVNLGRPVEDRTGLTGEFNMELEFAFTPPNGAPASAAADPLAPSIFTAVQEQLGLKLESAKGKGEVIVIDQTEKPSEN